MHDDLIIVNEEGTTPATPNTDKLNWPEDGNVWTRGTEEHLRIFIFVLTTDVKQVDVKPLINLLNDTINSKTISHLSTTYLSCRDRIEFNNRH